MPAFDPNADDLLWQVGSLPKSDNAIPFNERWGPKLGWMGEHKGCQKQKMKPVDEFDDAETGRCRVHFGRNAVEKDEAKHIA